MKTIKSTQYTGVRNLIRSVRLYEKVRKMEKLIATEEGSTPMPQLLIVYDNGRTSQVSGQNKLLTEFVQNGGYVGDFSGKGTQVKTVHDPDYNRSNLKLLRYDQCFKICGGDARKGSYIDILIEFKRLFCPCTMALFAAPD